MCCWWCRPRPLIRLRLPVDQQVVYELGEWPLGMQASAAQVMAESGIPHGWDGTDLVVQLDHEATVDALLEAVEAEQPGIVGADWLDDDEDTAGAAPAAAGWQVAEADTEDAVGAGRVPMRTPAATTTTTPGRRAARAATSWSTSSTSGPTTTGPSSLAG